MNMDSARRLVDAALLKAEALKLKPLAVAVFDARGCLKAFVAQDGTSLLRGEVARARPMVLWRSAWDRARFSSGHRSRPFSSAP